MKSIWHLASFFRTPQAREGKRKKGSGVLAFDCLWLSFHITSTPYDPIITNSLI